MADNTTRMSADPVGNALRADASTSDADGSIVDTEVEKVGRGGKHTPSLGGPPRPFAVRSLLRRRVRAELVEVASDLRAFLREACRGQRAGYAMALAGAGAAAASAPIILGLNYTLGDPGGSGQNIVISGLNLTGATSAMFGGSSATISGNTPTTLTCALPAHASGSGLDVVVTTPNGVSAGGAGLFEYWGPTQLTGVDTYLDSGKGVTSSLGLISSVADQASARTWDQATSGFQPSAIASVFGTLPSIRCNNAAASHLSASVARDFNASAWSAFFVGKTTTVAPTAANATFNAPLTAVGWSGGWSGFGLSSGDAWLQGQGTPSSLSSSGQTLDDGTPHLLGFTCDNTGFAGSAVLYVGATSVASGTNGGGTTFAYGCDSFGAGYDPTGFGDGWDQDLGAVIIVSGIMSSSERTKLNRWSQQRFGTG